MIEGCYSVCPSVCGWNAVNYLVVVLRIRKTHFQKWENNGAPRSETMSSSNPWRRTTFAKITFIVSKPHIALEHGIKCVIFVNRSTSTKVESCPSKSGKSVMKSVEIQAQHRPNRLKKPRTESVGTDRLGRVPSRLGPIGYAGSAQRTE